MGRRHYYLVIIVVVCAFYRCTPTPPKFEEMIGVWKAKDGATIQLNADSTFVIKNFDSYFLFMAFEDTIKSKIDIYGKWTFPIVDFENKKGLQIIADRASRSSDSILGKDTAMWLWEKPIKKRAFLPIFEYRDLFDGFLTKRFIRVTDSATDYYYYLDFRKKE